MPCPRQEAQPTSLDHRTFVFLFFDFVNIGTENVLKQTHTDGCFMHANYAHSWRDLPQQGIAVSLDRFGLTGFVSW